MPYTVRLIYIADSYSSDKKEDPNLHAPLSLISLRNYIVNKNGLDVSVRIHTLAGNETIDALSAELDLEHTGLVGFSCYFWNIKNSMRMAEKIKRRFNRITIAIGGAESEETTALMEENPFLDLCVRGEGEELFYEIVSALSAGKKIPPLKGLTVREGGKIKDYGGRGVVCDLNSLPTIYTDEFISTFKPGQPLHYYTERGCFSNCKYCTQKPPLRRTDIARVEAELKRLFSAPNVSEICIIDSDFSYDLSRAAEVFGIISRYNRGDKIIRAHFGFLNYDENIIRLLKDNSINIMTAFQSTNLATLKIAARNISYDFETREKILEECLKTIDPDKVNVAFIYGLPGDDYSTLGESLRWAQKVGLTDLWIVQLLALPATTYRTLAGKYGIEYKKQPFYNVLKSSTFSKAEMRKARSSIFWFYRLYKMLESSQLKALSAQNIHIWDVVQGFPYLGWKKMAPFMEGKDTGDFLVKQEKKYYTSSLALSHLARLSENNSVFKILLKIIKENAKKLKLAETRSNAEKGK